MQLFLIRAARQCRLFGWRKASALLLELASFSSKERSVTRQLVIDLLAIGFIRRARNKILAARSNYKDLMSFEGQDKRFLDYIDWNVFSSRLESDLDESRRQLVSFLRESNYLAKKFPFDLSVYTDFILISNSRTHLSAQDVEALKCMKAPVFVFLNHANPAFQKLLVRHGLGDIPHLLVAGKNGLVNHDLRLIYGSYGIHDFNLLACLIRNGSDSHFREYFLQDIIDSNNDIDFVCIDELSALVDRVYSKNSFLAQDGYAPMASLGWLVIELFTAFVQMASNASRSSNGNQRSVWLAGFDLSASYVFESNFKCIIHDFVYEYAALNYRFASGLVKQLGCPDRFRSQRKPPSTRLTNKQMWSLRGAGRESMSESSLGE